jgi:hypothetical protein
MTGDDAEQIATQASAESGLDDRPRCDPRLVAVGYLGLRLRPLPKAHARLDRGVIVYDSEAPPETIAYMISHECGHALIAEAGYRLTPALEEQAASRVGCALLLPRRAYLRDVYQCCGDMPTLRELWPLASAWVLARRMAEVCEDVISSRWRRGRLVDRTCAGRATTLERDLVRGVVAPSLHARIWPTTDGAIVVFDAEAISAHGA